MKSIKELITSLLEGYLLLMVIIFVFGGTAVGAFAAVGSYQINVAVGAIGGFFVGTSLTALIAGPIVLLMEIRDATRETAATLKKQNQRPL